MIRIVAPATTANLGPGFDCLGAALSARLVLEVAVSDAPLRHEAPVRGTDLVAVTESNFGFRCLTPEPLDLDELRPGVDAFIAAVQTVAGDDLPRVEVSGKSEIPVARGLGSSSALIAAGLLLGSVIAEKVLDSEKLLRLGTPLEGHPDNLAAALFGGLCLVVPDGEDYQVMRFAPVSSVRPCIVVPRERLATKEARRALPAQVPLGDAVANVARTSGLVALLTGKIDPTAERLLACTEDLLHQPYRAPLMPATAEAIARLREEGVAAAISGAGPSVVCFVPEADLDRFRAATSGMDGWNALELDWDMQGARIEERIDT